MAGVKGRSGGSSRKSVEELKLTGTYREDRHGKILVPKDQRVRVKPQDHISNPTHRIDREAIFNWFADILYEQGMTQEVDSILLSQLVEAHALYIEAMSFARSDPEAILGRKLASSVALDAAKEVRILMAEFRLTPTSRTVKLSGPDAEQEDPVTAFLNAKVISRD